MYQFTLGAHVKETEKNGLCKGNTGSVSFEGETAVKVHPQPSHTTYREVEHILVNTDIAYSMQIQIICVVDESSFHKDRNSVTT